MAKSNPCTPGKFAKAMFFCMGSTEGFQMYIWGLFYLILVSGCFDDDDPFKFEWGFIEFQTSASLTIHFYFKVNFKVPVYILIIFFSISIGIGTWFIFQFPLRRHYKLKLIHTLTWQVARYVARLAPRRCRRFESPSEGSRQLPRSSERCESKVCLTTHYFSHFKVKTVRAI